MTDIQNGTIMTVQQFFSEVNAGQAVDAHTGKKLVKLDKDGKQKEGSAKIKILNQEEVEDLTAAPIYVIETSLKGIPNTENIECRQFVLDCNKLSASIVVTDVPKQNQTKQSETEAEFYDKEYKEDAKESKVKKK